MDVKKLSYLLVAGIIIFIGTYFILKYISKLKSKDVEAESEETTTTSDSETVQGEEQEQDEEPVVSQEVSFFDVDEVQDLIPPQQLQQQQPQQAFQQQTYQQPEPVQAPIDYLMSLNLANNVEYPEVSSLCMPTIATPGVGYGSSSLSSNSIFALAM